MDNSRFTDIMFRPHTPLFQQDASTKSMPPANFNSNTVEVAASEMIDVGDAPFMAEPSLASSEPTHEPDLGVQDLPAAPAATTPAPEIPTAPAKPAAPTQQPAQSAQVDPVVAMTQSMRAAFPNLLPDAIAAKVADAMKPAEELPDEPEVDPDTERLNDIETRLKALRTQAAEEGTDDYAEDIEDLERDRIRLDTRIEMRREQQEQEEITQFAKDANEWDARATAAFPAADQPNHPLALAVDAAVARIKAADPDYFIRDPRAGFALVALEAENLGIAPIQRGTAPSPHAPSPIQAPVALPGSVQGSHRPGGEQQDSSQDFFKKMAAAEKAGLASELDLAREFTGGSMHGVTFA